ncbi:hypothetical protein [Actinomyces procaprae]|uniref:hypothetical protein n=1 Tax=Actinomyces procaprae TaxID=2560010 RepID=UPI0010A29535|nr:hypothetical protein [Actinomyces procaprae]
MVSYAFIDIGISITKLLLLDSGNGTAAAVVGEVSGLLQRFQRRCEHGAIRALSAETIARDVAAEVPREHEGISDADWSVVGREVAALIDRLTDRQRRDAGFEWEKLRDTLLENGGKTRRARLADESAKQAFDLVLAVACKQVVKRFSNEEALRELLTQMDRIDSTLSELRSRPAQASKTRVVVAEHADVIQELAPEELEARETEIADLHDFCRDSGRTWYAVEAEMVSGKTALTATLARRPPADAKVISFFVRRIGGDGNDRERFSFVVRAQLADILGEEYVAWTNGPEQPTEFTLQLERAAIACRAAREPQVLVLLVDGIDEDVYFEHADQGGVSSILSLLPRQLPDGIKIITASRPNPRLPEDVLCEAAGSRDVVPLVPSTIARRSINTKSIERFFENPLAANIGAFLAASGGALTENDLRSLLNIFEPSRKLSLHEVNRCVSSSPGRMLTPVKVEFGNQDVCAYRLGHDAVLRAILREIDSDAASDNGDGDERWWAGVRERALAPYRADIVRWVRDRAERGWSRETPAYMLSEACFDMVASGEGVDAGAVEVLLEPGRYEEIRRRSGTASRVLRVLDREYLKVLDGELPERLVPALHGIAEKRDGILARWRYVPGVLATWVTHLSREAVAVMDIVLAVFEPSARIDALKEVVRAAIESGRGDGFVRLVPEVIDSVVAIPSLRDSVLGCLVDLAVQVYVCAHGTSDCELVDVGIDAIRESLERLDVGEVIQGAGSSPNGNGRGDSASCLVSFAESAAREIRSPSDRARLLVSVARALVDVGGVVRAREVAEEALAAASEFESPSDRARELVDVARALVDVGGVVRAREVAEEALAAASEIESPSDRARVLVGVVRALVEMGQSGRAREVAEEALAAAREVESPWGPWGRIKALVEVEGALVEMGQSGRARAAAEEALAAAREIESPSDRAWALADVALGLVAAERVEQAGEVADQALAAARESEYLPDRVWALAYVAGALADAGDASRALAVAREIESPSDRAWALAHVAGALADAGDASRALAVAREIVSPSDRAWALAHVAGALAAMGDVVQAGEVAEQALVAARQPKKSRDRTVFLVDLARALADAGWAERAREVADQALAAVREINKQSGFRAVLLMNMARASALVGDVVRAREVAEEALATAHQIESSSDRVKALAFMVGALAGVARALADVGGVVRAREVAEEALATAHQIESPWDPWSRIDVLADVARALVDVGGVVRAREVAEEALATAHQIEEPWDPSGRIDVLADVARALVDVGDVVRAREVAEEALAAASEIEYPPGRARALVDVARALAEMGQSGRAREFAEEALAAARESEYPSDRGRLLVDVARALAEMGQSGRAREVVEEALAVAQKTDFALLMDRALALARALSIVIQGLVREGDVEAAEALFKGQIVRAVEIESSEASRSYLGTLAEAGVEVAQSHVADPEAYEGWLSLARSAIARSWLYGAPVFERFDVLACVAPEFATRLVDERLLAEDHGEAV